MVFFARQVRGGFILVRPFLRRGSQIKSRPGALPRPEQNFKAAKSPANEIPLSTTSRHDGWRGMSLSLSSTVLSTGVSIILCTVTPPPRTSNVARPSKIETFHGYVNKQPFLFTDWPRTKRWKIGIEDRRGVITWRIVKEVDSDA